MLPTLDFRVLRILIPFVLLGVAILGVLWVSPGRATDGRDFAGFYDTANGIDLGDEVTLTLYVRVFNYSDADVANVSMVLSGNVDPDANYGGFSAVSIKTGESAALSGQFTIPKEEYSFWQNGGPPALWVMYQDVSGNDVRRRVELLFAPGEGQ